MMVEKEWTGLTVLGKVIGTHTGWDYAGDEGHLQFYDFIPNALGTQFIGGQIVPEMAVIHIDFSNGTVFLYSGPDGTYATEIEKPDWSVFNKE